MPDVTFSSLSLLSAILGFSFFTQTVKSSDLSRPFVSRATDLGVQQPAGLMLPFKAAKLVVSSWGVGVQFLADLWSGCLLGSHLSPVEESSHWGWEMGVCEEDRVGGVLGHFPGDGEKTHD